MKSARKLIFLLVIAAICCAVSGVYADDTVHKIILNNGAATLDGAAVPEYDYVWHADPGTVHNEVNDAPAEYYTGKKPSGEDTVYVAHDIFYFPEVPVSGFRQVDYDGEQEWAYYYPTAEYSQYIWAMLPKPKGGNDVPTRMMHSEGEAFSNPVLHITKAGSYELSGSWKGQIWIDLGDQDKTFADKNAKVTLILNGVNVECTVAPALVFYSVYESDNGWKDRQDHGAEIDISDSGAHVIIADNSENTFNGTNIYRMLKTKYKDNSSEQKKLRKIDAAFYSFQSLLIEGQSQNNGKLNIISGFEGLGSELHLTQNGGFVYIKSQDDGVNANEDDVSVITINNGEMHIVAGLDAEGDGMDSNGFLVINGGVVIALAKPVSDSGLDSSRGSFINGGNVIATGAAMDWAESDSKQVTMNLQFASDRSGNDAIIVTDTNRKVIFAYDPDNDESTGSDYRGYRGVVISSPDFKVGETYNVYAGGEIQGFALDGIYLPLTISDFSGASRQVYTGSDLQGFPGGGMPPDGENGQDGGEDMRGGPMDLFKNISGVTINQGSVTITEEGANNIIAMMKEMNPSVTATASQFTGITQTEVLFSTFDQLMRGSDSGMGGPGGGMGGPGGGMGGPGGGMGGPGGGMGGPGGGMGGQDGPSGEDETGEPSTDFLMNDMVNNFIGLTDETN